MTRTANGASDDQAEAKKHLDFLTEVCDNLYMTETRYFTEEEIAGFNEDQLRNAYATTCAYISALDARDRPTDRPTIRRLAEMRDRLYKAIYR